VGQAKKRATNAEKVVLGSEPRDRFLVGMLRPHELTGSARGFGRLGQHRRAVRMLLAVERQGLLVVRHGLGHVQGQCAIPGKDEEPPRAVFDRVDLGVRMHQPDQLQCLGVVVGEQLRVVEDALTGEAFDPLGGALVPADPLCPGDLAVGNVSGEHMPEGVLGLAPHGGTAGGADKLPPGQLV
jgi:hypothetical protein